MSYFQPVTLSALLLSTLFLASGSGLQAEQDKLDFNRDIRPILSDRCFHCHGPDAGNRSADLRLDVRDDATAETASGLQAIHPGDANVSEIIKRILSKDPDEVMPPPKSKLNLTETQKQKLVKWVNEGAEYAQHWAFESLEPIPVPTPNNTDRLRNPIDHFIQNRLETEELLLSSEANQAQLIRRATYDITGLPPTPAATQAFLANNDYDALIQRLLDSKQYGERMASEWLDVARYSDSYGFQVDRDRFVWPWRDWVIRAFNDNLGYDDFITWQLAGDLLPNATKDQILATTFNRLHSQKVEGGSVPEEFRIEYVSDRAHTAGTAFLGLTMECCRCHDHKYDPLSQKEYYQLTSFFANVNEAGLYSYFTDSTPTPTMLLPDEEQEQRMTELEAKIHVAELALAPSTKEITGEIGYFTFDERTDGKFPNLANPDKPAKSSPANQTVAGKRGKALKLTGDDAINFEIGNFTRNDPFSISLWIQTPDVKERAVVFHRSRAWTDAASRGYELLIKEGHLAWSLIHFWPGNAISIRTVDPLPIGTWTHVTVTYDGSSRADGLHIYQNGIESTVTFEQDNLFKNITGGGGDHITIGERFRDRGFKSGLVDDFRVFATELSGKAVATVADAPPATAPPIINKFNAKLTQLRNERSKLVDSMTEIMVMDELAKPRQSYLLNRGAYDDRAEAVTSDTPAILPPFPSDQPRNRLGFARWLTSPNQPLTARVTVNRYWQLFFGQGLVSTPEDFGSQGNLPTHPELLDWLAKDFMDHSWDVKRLVRQMVTSQTYRQSSQPTKAAQEKDPENLLYARAPRYRLPAEMIRDSALAASGLLVYKVGGPPTKPYEVAASFKPVKHEEGEGLYRRSLYTYWKRTSPAPVMIALDAPKRDVCMVKRETTATPLQAFVFMNDPQFVEAARVLSASLTKQYRDDTASIVADAFHRLVSRQPSQSEHKVLTTMLEEQTQHFASHANQAKDFLNIGQAETDAALDAPKTAALAVVINALMAYDETVMKR